MACFRSSAGADPPFVAIALGIFDLPRLQVQSKRNLSMARLTAGVGQLVIGYDFT
jgi:hypothetical protein